MVKGNGRPASSLLLRLDRKGVIPDDCGVSLIETLLAVTIAVIGAFGMGSVIYVATAATKNQGTETTRATIYAQDKVEKLLSLASVPVPGATTASFGNCIQSSSTQFALSPSDDCNTTGIDASGWSTGLLAGGAITPAQLSCPSSGASLGYMDFLDASGNQLTGASCSAATGSGFSYVRMWQIADANPFGASPALKQITVAVYSLSVVNVTVPNPSGPSPKIILTSYVSDPN